MYPILARYGSFLLYSYTAAMGVGLLLALGLAAWDGRRRTAIRMARDRRTKRPCAGWLDGVIVALGAALVVGRVVFVAANWDYYRANVDESWLLWQGGISYHGAVVAGLLALWAWCRVRSVSFDAVGGMLALPAALWSAFGWLACYLEGCVYGRETFIGPLAASLPDSFGVFAVRYQTQLMGLVFSVLALGVLWWVARAPQTAIETGHSFQGMALFWLAVLLLSAGRAAVDLLRGDLVVMLGGLRVDFVLDVVLALVGLVGMVVTRMRDSRTDRYRNDTELH